jgi:hypothetical protein
MPFTQHELELRQLADQRITSNLLPDTVPLNVWAGRGSGEPCSLCDQPVPPGEIEYEIDNPAAGDARSYRFHMRCHAMWQLALSNRNPVR